MCTKCVQTLLSTGCQDEGPEAHRLTASLPIKACLRRKEEKEKLRQLHCCASPNKIMKVTSVS